MMVLMFPRSKGPVSEGRIVEKSMQQQLKLRSIAFDQAVARMVDGQGNVDLGLLDRDLCGQFFRQLRDQRSEFLHLVPLLLWQNCYYLGCPVAIEPELLGLLKERLGMAVNVVQISEASYRTWVRQQVVAGGRCRGRSMLIR
jgi:hypothetical protein